MKISRKTGLRTALALSAVLALAACESSEERAQKHFEAAQELIAEGDVTRALVELKNVFKLDPSHKDARMAAARLHQEQGNFGNAFREFRLLVEYYPDTVEARIELAEIAILALNWEEAERHGRAALELAPDNQRVKAINTILDYANARRDGDVVQATLIGDDILKLLEATPESLILRRAAVDQTILAQKFDQALTLVNAGLDHHPKDLVLHETRVQLQARARDLAAVGASLKEMVELFPSNVRAQQLLIAWFLEQKDLDGAEAFLRSLSDAEDAGNESKLTVVRFLLEARGSEAALEELERLIAAEPDNIVFPTLRASVEFDGGDREKAIADLEGAIAAGEGDAELFSAKVVLARMLLQTGNSVGARARIEEVIAADPSHVEALKMRAAWLIDEDKPDEAVLDLRTALAGAPEDPLIMTLMARAHERAGARDLAGERYALAVELSQNAPEESSRYAQFLVQEERMESAKAVLAEALNATPENVALLRDLGRLHRQTEDWSEVTRIIWKLRALETQEATQAANALEAETMLGQERLGDTVAFLEELLESGEGNPDAALTALIRTKMRAGENEDAIALVDERLQDNPDNPLLLYLRAGLHLAQEERLEAAGLYERILDAVPGHQQSMTRLNAILISEDRADEAIAMVDEQIEKANNPSAAMFLKATRLELEKDYDGAIAIYEKLYERNSGNVVIANNLASMITTYRDDPADLDRAFAIARRLKSSDVPAFQDTYGWIEYRRGNYDEALKYLEPAAIRMTQHALVQYHLGMLYLALDRKDDAQAQLAKAIELAEEDPAPQFKKAREVLADLESN